MANKTPKKRKTKKTTRKSKSVSKKTAKTINKKTGFYFILILLLPFVAYVTYLDFRITSKFEGKIWSLPSHVYARPLELYVDKALSAKQFEQELKLIGYTRVTTIPTTAGQYRLWDKKHFELISRDFKFGDGMQKGQSLRVDFSYKKISGLYKLFSHDRLSLVRLDPAKIGSIYPTQKEDRKLIKLEDVPKQLVLALLAVEDRRFYQHWGVDPRSIVRAAWANLIAGGTVQGASTLTQQLVKNLFLSPERSLTRKINEAIMSLLLELHYDKALILETYINEIYLGQDGGQGIHGFARASSYYFNVPLKKLSRDKLALLVGLVKGASWYNPRRQPKRALQRRNQVLILMHQQGIISEIKLKQLKARKLSVTARSPRSSNRFPAFIDLVKRQLRDDYDEEDLRSVGLNIFTTIDPVIQLQAEKSVKSRLPSLEKSYAKADKLQAAIIVVSPENGEIQALVGDRKPDFPGFNRAVDAVRQVGSLIKPGIYLSALQKSEQFNLASILNDRQLRLKGGDGEVWSPQNYDRKYKGDILLYQSLMLSRNVPTVRLGLKVGLADIVKTLQALGVKRDVPPYPSMTLGAFNLSPFDVASMYQTFAAKGFHIPLRAIREVLDVNGQPLNRYPLKLKQTLDEKPVYLVNTILHKVTEDGTARSLQKRLATKVAGKTGTTDDLRDSWFAGFTEDRLAVAWIGRDDNKTTGLTGASGALRLWADLMTQIPLEDLQLDLPEGMESHWIDSVSGGISEQGCQGAVELPFLSGTQPVQRAECKSTSLFQKLKDLF
jgi:penicillin-binding protein 1B